MFCSSLGAPVLLFDYSGDHRFHGVVCLANAFGLVHFLEWRVLCVSSAGHDAPATSLGAFRETRVPPFFVARVLRPVFCFGNPLTLITTMCCSMYVL